MYGGSSNIIREALLLLQITTQCLEGCSHCMANATPNGEHMSENTVNQAIKFIKLIKPFNVQITGGEPTLHPNFYEICVQMHKQQKEGATIILESNGSFIADAEKTEKVKDLVKRSILVQVRTHPVYYPNYKEIFNNKELRKITPHVYDDEINLLPFGRAIDNHRGEINMSVNPSCSNMFLTSRQVRSFVDVIYTMESHGFFCKPLVAANGNIHVGETTECQRLGTVWDSPEMLFNTLNGKLPCNRCGLIKNIPRRAMDLLIVG